VPVAEVGDRVLYDSRVIIEWLTTFHGWGDLRAPADHWREANLVNAIDGALESAIELFYLRRAGIDVSGIPFGTRQVERMDAIFAWLSSELGQDGFGAGLGLPEISLCATLDWMDFRETYPTAKLEGAIPALRAAYRERPSLAETRPIVS
jgi:glutathione S-transferase